MTITFASFALPRKNCFNLQTMNFFVQRSELRDLYDKVAAGERVSETDAHEAREVGDREVGVPPASPELYDLLRAPIP